MLPQLSASEVTIIKGILKHYPEKESQEILAHFSVPSRPVNPARIDEIKKGHKRYRAIPPASKSHVDDFLSGKASLSALMQNREPLLKKEGDEYRLRVETVFGEFKVDIGLFKPIFQPYEGAKIELKRTYESESIPAYAKILAGMVNASQAGRIVFGVSDGREVVGSKVIISSSDMNKMQECIKNHFAPNFGIEMEKGYVLRKQIFCLRVCPFPVSSLPVICQKNESYTISEGNSRAILKEGVIYYRYGDETRPIGYPELRGIMDAVLHQQAEARK